MSRGMLTGNTGFRRRLFGGKLIVTVEYWRRVIPRSISSAYPMRFSREWRDADAMDMVAIARGEIQEAEPKGMRPPKPVPNYPPPSDGYQPPPSDEALPPGDE